MKILKIIPILLIFISCETNNSFRTEAGVKKDLQGTWDLVIVAKQKENPMTWIFDGEKVTILQYFRNSNILFKKNEGTFSVKTTMTTPYLYLENTDYDGKWIIISLDKHILTMDHTAPGTNALDQLDFYKQ